MAYGFNPTRRFGLSDEEEDERNAEMTRSGAAGVLSDVRVADPRAAAVQALLSGGPTLLPAPPRPRNQLAGLADDDNVPIIDLGDDAEVIIPRTHTGLFGLAEDGPEAPSHVQDRPASLRSTATGGLLSSLPNGRLAHDDRPLPGPYSTAVPVRHDRTLPDVRMSPAQRPAPRGFDLAPLQYDRNRPGAVAPVPVEATAPVGLADDDSDPPGTTVTRADGTSYIVGPNGEQLPTNTPAMASESDDEEIGADINADSDLEVSAPVDPRRRAKLFGPAPQTTEYEDAAIRRGRELDQRAARGQRIAAGVAGGLGLLGLLTGSDVATGLGQAAAGAGGAIPTDVEEQMRARAEQRRVREQGGIDRENALVNADNEAMRQDQQDQLRMQAAQSDAAVNEARVAEMQREAQASELEQAARNGNAEGFRRFIRGRAEAIQHSGTHDPILDAIMDPTFQSINDPDLLRGMLNSIDAVDRRRGGKGAGGSGASEHTVTDPRTGITTTVRSGGGGQQQRPSPTGTPTPGSPRPGRPRPGAPSPAPAGTDPDAAAPSPEQQYLDELRAMTEAYPDLREGEFDIARTAVMRNRLSISDLTSPDTRRRAAAQGVVRTAIRRYRVGTGADQARMQQQAQSTYATQVGGDVVMPETVDPVVFAPMAQRAEPVYQDYVAPFLQARRSLEAARRAGVGEAGILLALQGANNDTIANFVRERGVRDPNAARALQRLKNSASLMREMYGRTQSGAAISPTEWSQFQNIMGMNNLYLNGSAQFQAAMEDLEQNGRRVVSSRFTPAGEHARDYASYFYRSLAGATGGQ